MDGDGQHDIGDVWKLYELASSECVDLVIGRRPHEGGFGYRRLGKFLIRTIANRLLFPGTEIYDINSGMKVYRSDLAKKYLKIAPDGMPFSDFMTFIFLNKRRYVVEHPITVLERHGGRSTITTKTAFDTIWALVVLLALFNIACQKCIFIL